MVGDGSKIDPSKAVGHVVVETEIEYTERDVAMYALSVGAGLSDPLDRMELDLVCDIEGRYRSGYSVRTLPSFASCFIAGLLENMPKTPGLSYDPSLLLHGEHVIEVLHPLPTSGKVRSKSRIVDIRDKGKGALIVIKTQSVDVNTGRELCVNLTSCFLRGAGQFATGRAAPLKLPVTRGGAGGDVTWEGRSLSSGKTAGGDVTGSSSSSKLRPSSDSMPMPRKREKTRSETSRPFPPSPTTTPSSNFDGQHPAPFVWEETTLLAQALLFRLCGDVNPIHSNMEVAAKAGFNRPILHGLCTYGYAARAIVRCCCPGHPECIRKLHGRFLLHVFPGETLRTEIWRGNGNRHKSGNLGGEVGGGDHIVEQVTFRCSVKERNYAAVLMGTAELISLQARL
ncbi:hypothetical protein CBR_g50912 [Chara braunii]|uniref:Uncharacterized protein n=1 Tax=Chara braunii TaxID=69332 RepID=A0A388M7X3_CHABU|nr:hypothetical protein CBR_g50912 [Chara braunii]|eukprot:GBG90569.1 hypothetical protein CBR_g50912 [Chara braunii]